jgi:non-ribosomal peptide synthetase component F
VARVVLDRSGPPDAGPVACLMQSGVSLVVAMLGVLKAGAAFVPIDPALPRARLVSMHLEEFGIEVPAHELLVSPTVADMARLIERLGPALAVEEADQPPGTAPE